MSVEAPEMTREDALAEVHELINTMPEAAAHEFVSLLMDVEAAARELEEEFEVQHKETALETVHASLDAYPEVVATVLKELFTRTMLAELLAEYL